MLGYPEVDGNHWDGIKTPPCALNVWRHVHAKDLKASKVTLLKDYKYFSVCMCVCGGGGKSFLTESMKIFYISEEETEWNRSALYAEEKKKGTELRD